MLPKTAGQRTRAVMELALTPVDLKDSESQRYATFMEKKDDILDESFNISVRR